MSVTLTPQEEWCNTARDLVQKKAAKSAEIHTKLSALDGLMANRPPEMSDTEWQQYENSRAVVEQAAHKGDAGKPAKPFPFSARGDVETFIGETEQHLARIRTRQAAYAKASTEKKPEFDKLGAKGKETLKQFDDPATVLDQSEGVRTRANEAGKRLSKVKGYFDDTEHNKKITALKTDLDSLDLAKSKIGVKEFEAFAKQAEDEKTEAGELAKKHAKAADKPNDVGGWRALIKQERAFEDVSADIESLLQQLDDPNTQKPPSKVQQVNTIRGEIETYLSDWRSETTSITIKLSADAKTKGSVAWFKDRLKLLQAPTAPDQNAKAQEQAMQEWSAFIADVTKKWNSFNKNGGNRGCVADQGVLTTTVKGRIDSTNTISAGGRTWAKSDSTSAGVSYHTPLPPKYLIPEKPHVKSFIYHLQDYADDDNS